MNPMIAAQMDQIHQALGQLDELLGKTLDYARHQGNVREELQKENWSHRRELATMQTAVKDYDTLEAENERLRGLLAELSVRLHGVLEQTKTLSDAFRS